MFVINSASVKELEQETFVTEHSQMELMTPKYSEEES